MKARATIRDCQKCREQQFQEYQYDVFSNLIDSAATSTAAMMITVLERQGKSPEEIKAFFEDYCFVSSMPEVFGKKITAVDAIRRFEEKYDIDFNKIECHIVTKQQFMAQYRKDDPQK
jgi:hypothetical protein